VCVCECVSNSVQHANALFSCVDHSCVMFKLKVMREDHYMNTAQWTTACGVM